MPELKKKQKKHLYLHHSDTTLKPVNGVIGVFANENVYLGDKLLGDEWWISPTYWLLLSRLPACLRQVLFDWQQPPGEFIPNICSPYYSNDHCQSWWISVCIIDPRIWQRDRVSMHHWRNSLVLWANPLGALIRIKCLSHLFSVADRNNESLNIVFRRNPSPSRPKDILRLFTLSLTKLLHQIEF